MSHPQTLSQNSEDKPPEKSFHVRKSNALHRGAVQLLLLFTGSEASKEMQKQTEPAMPGHKPVSNQPSPPLGEASNMSVCPHNFTNLLLKKTDHTGHRNVKELPKLFSF